MNTIILTTTVNVNYNKCCIFQHDKHSRLEVYLKSIKQWLTKTNFNIILVENSGYHYDELNPEKELYKDRFEVIAFQEHEIPEANYLRYNGSKGASEFFAIDYVYRNSKLIHLSKFVIKVTGRYFIDELESYLSNFHLDDYECLVQHNRDRCEMVGSHYKNFMGVFNTSLYMHGVYSEHVEDIWKTRTSDFQHILVCKEFTIEKTKRGGIDDSYDTI